MSAPTIPGGSRRFKFTKHKGKTFAQVHNTQKNYVMWVLGLEAPTGQMLDLQRYFAARGGIIDLLPPPLRPEYKPMFIGRVFSNEKLQKSFDILIN
jgi:hypothetical protein